MRPTFVNLPLDHSKGQSRGFKSLKLDASHFTILPLARMLCISLQLRLVGEVELFAWNLKNSNLRNSPACVVFGLSRDWSQGALIGSLLLLWDFLLLHICKYVTTWISVMVYLGMWAERQSRYLAIKLNEGSGASPCKTSRAILKSKGAASYFMANLTIKKAVSVFLVRKYSLWVRSR